MSDFDTDYTDEVVCPHCGHVHTDSWEIFLLASGCVDGCECCECERLFNAVQYVTIQYSTYKPGEDPDHA